MTHPLFNTSNSVREKLAQGDTAYGMFLHLGHSEVAEMVGSLGLDFVILDMEGSPMTSREVVPQLQGLNGSGCAGIVRVPRHDTHLIGRALDIGANGVMIPKVENAEEAKIVASATRYAPMGTRGINAFRATAYGENEQEYMDKSDKEALAIVQVESPDAVEAVGKMALIEDVDVIFMGIGDLCLSSGLYGNPTHPDINEARQKVLDACRQTEKIPGIFASTPELANVYAGEGFRFIAVGNDLKYLKLGVKDMMSRLSRDTK